MTIPQLLTLILALSMAGVGLWLGLGGKEPER